MKRIAIVACCCLTTTACVDRLEPPLPPTHRQIEQVQDWSHKRSGPYDIPETALRAYAYAAWAVAKQKNCNLGWPTLAALGESLSNHGRANDSQLGDDGTTTVPLRGLNLFDPAHPQEVADTDAGFFDGDPTKDIPIGPLQIMPSRWEQFNAAVEPDAKPNPDNINDASLTLAGFLCSVGDPSTPDGWANGVQQINANPEFVKQVHAIAKKYSRLCKDSFYWRPCAGYWRAVANPGRRRKNPWSRSFRLWVGCRSCRNRIRRRPRRRRNPSRRRSLRLNPCRRSRR